jgi:membrane protein involved in colicin uptake
VLLQELTLKYEKEAEERTAKKKADERKAATAKEQAKEKDEDTKMKKMMKAKEEKEARSGAAAGGGAASLGATSWTGSLEFVDGAENSSFDHFPSFDQYAKGKVKTKKGGHTLVIELGDTDRYIFQQIEGKVLNGRGV